MSLLSTDYHKPVCVKVLSSGLVIGELSVVVLENFWQSKICFFGIQYRPLGKLSTQHELSNKKKLLPTFTKATCTNRNTHFRISVSLHTPAAVWVVLSRLWASEVGQGRDLCNKTIPHLAGGVTQTTGFITFPCESRWQLSHPQPCGTHMRTRHICLCVSCHTFRIAALAISPLPCSLSPGEKEGA